MVLSAYRTFLTLQFLSSLLNLKVSVSEKLYLKKLNIFSWDVKSFQKLPLSGTQISKREKKPKASTEISLIK